MPVSSAPSPPSAVPTAREGHPADSERVHFIPELLSLPGHADAPVVAAQTVNGVLRVPENVQHVGWWDGSAYAGDPFGATVIAGHVDSATEGIGFFARLLKIKVGDRVTVRAGAAQAELPDHRGADGRQACAGLGQPRLRTDR